jgi:hypothetical protein
MYVKAYNVEALRRWLLMSDSLTRKAVVDFILACEALLSPSLKADEFTKAECDTIGKYLADMCQAGMPWWKPSMQRPPQTEKWS